MTFNGNGVPRDHAEAIGGLVVAHPSSPTATELEHAPGAWFHAAIDALERDTVPFRYWVKVRAGQVVRANGSSENSPSPGTIGAREGPASDGSAPGPRPTNTHRRGGRR
jgi:hypothetical protein